LENSSNDGTSHARFSRRTHPYWRKLLITHLSSPGCLEKGEFFEVSLLYILVRSFLDISRKLSECPQNNRGKVSRISPMGMDHEHSLKQLKQALRAHHQALEQLESALLEFEESISSGEAAVRLQGEGEQRGGVQLLSIAQLCQELGMGKSWIYRRLRSGELPSVRLGRTIKVRREELEEYLQSHHYPERAKEALQEENGPPPH
jgi:excisionase family DNA binding protein